MKFRPLGLLLALAVPGSADTTINSTDKYAYTANSGWINLRPDQPANSEGIVVGEYMCSGNAYAANFGWIDFGDGTPADGIRYRNTSPADYGVNHDGAGNLSGYAYGANFGWINFGWATSTDPSRPRFDLLTGSFSGFAYGANVGWINLGAGHLITDTMRCTDVDRDGLGDEWELQWFGNLVTARSTTDADADGESDLAEYLANTNPLDRGDRFAIVAQSIDVAAGEAVLEFITRPTRLYRIQSSDDLERWSDSGLGVFRPDPGALTRRALIFPRGPRRFFRIGAVKPLAP